MRRGRVGWANGVLVDGGGRESLLLDPVPGRTIGESRKVLITHAHSDHTYGLSTRAEKYCTAETRQLYEAVKERRAKRVHEIKLGETVEIGGCEVKAVSAGHMLGSCQFLIRTPSFTVLYTGDLNCVETLTTAPAEEASCDILIIEATFGHPSYRFPRRSAIYADVVRWTTAEISRGKLPVFQSYTVGKPQEMIKLFNAYTKIPVVCSPTIYRAAGVYVENGVDLSYLGETSASGRRALRRGRCVYLTSSAKGGQFKDASRAITSGWAFGQPFRRVASFPLSSHADYEHLMRFIGNVRPRKVYVYTGYIDALAAHVNQRFGIEAGPLPAIAQTKLWEF